MSKTKYKNLEKPLSSHGPADIAEYEIIGQDLVRVLILNVVYLAGLLAIYFINRNNHFLENFVSKIFSW